MPTTYGLPAGLELAAANSGAASVFMHGIYGAPPILSSNPGYINDLYRRGEGNATPPVRIYMELLDRTANTGDSIVVSALEFASMTEADKAAATPQATNPHKGKCGQDGGATQVLRQGVYMVTVSGRAVDDTAVTDSAAPANAIVAVVAKLIVDHTGAVVICSQGAGI